MAERSDRDDPPAPERRVKVSRVTPARRGSPWRVLFWIAQAVLLVVSGVLAVGGMTSIAEAEKLKAAAEEHLNGPGTTPSPVQASAAQPLGPGAEADAKSAGEAAWFFEQVRNMADTVRPSPQEVFDFGLLSSDWPAEAKVIHFHPDLPRQQVQAKMLHKAASVSRAAAFQKWDRRQATLRRVTRGEQDNQYSAFVWFPTPSGRVVKVRWQLTMNGNFCQLMGWEDLRTGATREGLFYAIESGHSTAPRPQRNKAFLSLGRFERALDEGDRKTAEEILQTLLPLGSDPALGYAVAIAEGRLAILPKADGSWDYDTAVAVGEQLVKAYPSRFAAHVLLAEAYLGLAGKSWRGGLEGLAMAEADEYLRVAGPDPEVLALKGRAQLGLKLPADDSFRAALDLDPYQPDALDWKRRADKGVFTAELVERLGKAPNPGRVYEVVAAGAEADGDFAALVAVAEKMHALKPNDLRAVTGLLTAYPRVGRAKDAAKVLTEASAGCTAEQKKQLAVLFATAASAAGQGDAAYPLLPDDAGLAAFPRMADSIPLRHSLNPVAPSPTPAERKAALDRLDALVAAHQKKHPADDKLPLYEGRVLNAKGQHKEAAEVLATAVNTFRFADDAKKNEASRYLAFRDELLYARYHSGNGVAAYREVKADPDAKTWDPKARPYDPEVFLQLAWRYAADRDPTGLSTLVEERRKKLPLYFDTVFWEAEVARLSGKPADAIPLYRKYTTNTFYSDRFSKPQKAATQAGIVRCQLQLGQVGDVTMPKPGPDTDIPPGTLLLLKALYDVKAGDPPAGELKLRAGLDEKLLTAADVYADADLGPLVRKEKAFDAFRKDFPPPK